MGNYIFEKFYENKQLFKPFVSWPSCVHLGLNNVDAISNPFLNNLQLKKNEHVLWVSKHNANWSSKDNAEKTPSGCIITDMRIYFLNITTQKGFEVAWTNIHSIIHKNNTFYIQRVENKTSYELAISDYAMLNKKIDNNNPIVAFLNDVAVHTSNENSGSKTEKSTSHKNENVVPKTNSTCTERANSVETEKNNTKSNKCNTVMQNVKQERRSFL